MNMVEEYANYAFVSYSHKDEGWAAWIQRKLEAYRLPSVIRKEASSTIPERIRPVFRDATDLGAGRLRNNLQKELESSRFLIVVCSPNSAQPNAEGKQWVNDEVTHFASIGRADRIVPVIVEGDERTAFCPKLKELGILAVDATKKSRARTLNDIVATLLGLRPDELWQREERLRRRKRAWRALAAAVALLVAAAGGWRWYDLTATHVEYYSDWVDEWGIPTGIPDARLTKDQVRNRLFSYRFEYRGRQKGGGFFATRVLRRVVMQDADGQVFDENQVFPFPLCPYDNYYLDRPSTLVIQYKEDGTLDGIDEQDAGERVVVRHKYSGQDNTDVEHVRLFDGKESDFSQILHQEVGVTEIRRFALVRDTNGRIKKKMFMRERGIPTNNGEGVFGEEFSYDRSGRIIMVAFLGNDGKPHVSRSGVAGCQYGFSMSGSLSFAQFVDFSGNLIRNSTQGGFAKRTYEHDDAGNVLRMTNLDENDLPTYDKNGVSIMTLGISGEKVATLSCLGPSNDPIRCLYCFSSMSFERTIDNGELTIRFFDEKGSPCKTMYFGAAGIRKTFRDGDLIRQEWLDETDSPIRGRNGEAGWISEWKNHHETKRFYFDESGNPARAADGTFGRSVDYNDDGLPTRFSYLDADGRPTSGPEGWSGWFREYKDGKPVRGRYVDNEGRLVCSTDGTAGYDSKYEAGKLVDTISIGRDGKPILTSDGYAGFSVVYEGGLVSSIYNFGTNREPVFHKDGHSGCKLLYDESGNMVRWDWVGLHGEPIMNKRVGCASICRAYDEFGNEVKHWWLGIDGAPCFSREGIAGWSARYDESGRLIEQVWRDIEWAPMMKPEDGAYGCRYEYDYRGKQLSKTFLGIDGRPAPCSTGFVSEKRQYDAFGNLVAMGYYDIDNRLYSPPGCLGLAGALYKYNRFGNMSMITFVGEDGKPLQGPDGVTTIETLYDSANLATGERYRDAEGRLVLRSPEGVAGFNLEHDAFGRIVRKRWIGANGAPCRAADGTLGWDKTYDEYGNELTKADVR